MLDLCTILMEHNGLKVGDPIKLTGAAMPRTIGRITRIFFEKDANEMAFDVMIKNPDAPNSKVEERWYPIYLNEIQKA